MMNITPDLIYILNFDITTYCNLHCPQCKRYDFDGNLLKNIKMIHMNLETIKNNINFDSMPNLQQIRNIPTYGDAIMHPNIEDWIIFFKDYDYLISTNGSLRTPGWWEDLAKFENLTVMFAIDGLEDTNEIYRINSNYNKIIKNAEAFINAGGDAIWQFIVFKHNEHQLEQAKKTSIEMGFTRFQAIFTDRSWFQGNKWPVKVNGEYLYDLEQASTLDNLARFDINNKKSNVDVDIALSLSEDQPDITHTANKNYVDTKISQIVSSTSNNDSNEYQNCYAFIKEEWFVNNQGYLLPCCQTSPYMDNDTDIPSQMWLNILSDPESININHHTIDEIFNSNFYTHQLIDSWQNDTKWTHPSCKACFSFDL